MGRKELSGLAEAIAEIDREIVGLSGRRVDLAARLGELKRVQGLPIRVLAPHRRGAWGSMRPDGWPEDADEP